MDLDCLICFGNHYTSLCNDRKPEHCPDCHVFIRNFSDHSSICGMKTWFYRKYEHLYVKAPIERILISCNVEFRFLKDGDWRKPEQGIEMYSSHSNAIFRFINGNDLRVLCTSFTPIRIVVVVKKNGERETFMEKLLLLSSRKQMMVGVGLNKPFNRLAANENHGWKTTLILAVTSYENLCVTVNVIPSGKLVRMYDLRFEEDVFKIPESFKLSTTTTDIANEADVPGGHLGHAAQVLIDDTTNYANEDCTDVNFVVCYGSYHSKDCFRKPLSKCSECHVPIERASDHAQNCGFKTLFLSSVANVLAKIPAIRFTVSSKSPISYLLGGNICDIEPGTVLFSSMADTYIKFASKTEFAFLSISLRGSESLLANATVPTKNSLKNSFWSLHMIEQWSQLWELELPMSI